MRGDKERESESALRRKGDCFCCCEIIYYRRRRRRGWQPGRFFSPQYPELRIISFYCPNATFWQKRIYHGVLCEKAACHKCRMPSLCYEGNRPGALAAFAATFLPTQLLEGRRRERVLQAGWGICSDIRVTQSPLVIDSVPSSHHVLPLAVSLCPICFHFNVAVD